MLTGQYYRDRRINPELAAGGRTSQMPGWIRPRRFGRALSDGPDVGGGHTGDNGRERRFTNTAVPRFDGTGCWQQPILTFRAIMRSNGWSPMTAALQLFTHLDGEALNVALLMLEKVRERWKNLVDGISEYYNSPGRLAVFRRRFESACRRPGVDPATFATELGILAVRGFAEMGESACDLMTRNKFIAAQQSCELRRYLDGAAADASIGDIVDSCRVWESHTDAGYDRCGGLNLDLRQTISQVTVNAKPQLVTARSAPLQEDIGHLVPTPGGGGRVASEGGLQLGGQRASHTARTGSSTVTPDHCATAVTGTGVGTYATRHASGWIDHGSLCWCLAWTVKWSRHQLGRGPCFSCGQQGHGVNRCSRMDVSFPFLLSGWSVDVRNGQYRASRIRAK